ncbi:MAG: redoxin domain-containing protein [Gammaproteobacteria bacterium]|nr:redoxin domain-containing protein [Gammaproteobacteria bacterium]
MNVAKVFAVTVLAGSVSIGLALFGERWLDPDDSAEARRLAVGSPDGNIETLPDLRLPRLDGREVRSSSWAGKLLVLHFWASWCLPCQREMAILDSWQQRYANRGLQVVGISIDRADAVARFLDDHPVNYPILLGNIETVRLSKQLGNRTGGLPFTVIFDAVGRRIFSQTGKLDGAVLDAEIAPRLAQRR